MTFRPILSAEDLPATLASHESLFLDFKSQQDPKANFEKAKDVTAFANAQGGTILIGAEEDRADKRLARYKPLPEGLAAGIVRGYDESIRDRCRPTPLVETTRIPHGVGEVVAVNVWPFPGQPVGARREEHSFAFPMRSGAETVYLQPDQLPMLTLPAIRRVAILLDAIPEGKREGITLKSQRRVGGGYDARRVRLESSMAEVVMRNTVTFTDLKHQSTVCVPASLLEHIWCSPQGDWFIAVPAPIDQAGHGILSATPTG